MSASPDAESLEELVARCQHGDHGAFAVLVRQLDEAVRDLVFRCGIPEPDVADVTSEIWLKTWTNIRLFNRQSKFTTWLFRIAVNASNDEHRRRRRRCQSVPVAKFEERMDRDPGVEDIGVAWSEILPFLEALPPHLREAVVLVDGHGLSLGEAASVVGVNYKTLASRLARGRRALKALLLAVPEEPVQ